MGETWDGPGVEAWRPWHPSEVAARLAGADVSWCVVGGWAIDLFVGRSTRQHEDLEIATIQPDIPEIRRRLAPLVFHAVGSGEVRRLADGEWGPPEIHQHWALDERAGEWRIDVMVEPGGRDLWVYRRDPRVTAPRATMLGVTAAGIPYLRPIGALLYKAKTPRPKDQADFDAVVGLLDDAERLWLRDAIKTVYGDHPWLDRLR